YDLQGNIVAVYNTATQTLEQTTDYYPYGMPHAISTNYTTSPATNRRKYGAKELQTDLGLNLYDFEARYQNPVLPHFTTPDLLATDYHSISPYTYCAADPINLIDPSGMTWENHSEYLNMINSINRRIESVGSEIQQLQSRMEENKDDKEKSNQLLTKIIELYSILNYLNTAKDDVQKLEDDKEHIYKLMNISGNEAHKVIKVNNKIYIQYSAEALIYHENAHIRQSLDQLGKLEFKNDELKNSGMLLKNNIYINASRNEIESYRIQYAFDSTSLPKNVSKISNISLEYLTKIYTPDKKPAYGFAHDLLKYFKTSGLSSDSWEVFF
ncbi:MAG: hypothetical protein NC111_00765, partial [Bacteroides sp.]|nr:hypothetical protein [Bacteroides sp.]MCM1413496.1 hypothetical protein [Bacteroides sp.]MCM1471050.1 hypothetical protein [Bacteroides sp.]